MTTSPTLANFEETQPTRGDLAFACSRNQHQVHDLLVRVVDESNFTQKELAKRSGIDEATLSRVLTLPRNVEINTVSKIVYAACGGTLSFALSYPGVKNQLIVLAADQKPTTSESTSARQFLLHWSTYHTAFPRLTGSTDQMGIGVFDRLANSSLARVTEVVHNA